MKFKPCEDRYSRDWRAETTGMTLISVSKVTRSQLTAGRHHSGPLSLLSPYFFIGPDGPTHHKRLQNIMSGKSWIRHCQKEIIDHSSSLSRSIYIIQGIYYYQDLFSPCMEKENMNSKMMMIGFLCCTNSQFTKLGFSFKLWFNSVRKSSRSFLKT